MSIIKVWNRYEIIDTEWKTKTKKVWSLHIYNVESNIILIFLKAAHFHFYVSMQQYIHFPGMYENKRKLFSFRNLILLRY